LHMLGSNFISHAGESILSNAGLDEWIAVDAEDYIRRAVHFTRDLQQLAELRTGLRNQLLSSPLCDAPRFARNFEGVLREIWKNWCEQKVHS
ncbi:MAG: hypothetical protein U1D97_02880, partial [Desulfuromonadales bacterium]|nr:hypothetical protein [Desulfuromonadales bacterium]